MSKSKVSIKDLDVVITYVDYLAERVKELDAKVEQIAGKKSSHKLRKNASKAGVVSAKSRSQL